MLPENHAAFTEFWPSTALILLYWLIFRAAYVVRTPLNQNEENISSLSAVLNSICLLYTSHVNPSGNILWRVQADPGPSRKAIGPKA